MGPKRRCISPMIYFQSHSVGLLSLRKHTKSLTLVLFTKKKYKGKDLLIL